MGPLEAYVSTGINSRMMVNDIVRFLVRADEASTLLAKIPNDAKLEDGTDDELAVAARLIDLFVGASQIGRGKATKVLYKKRPAFIPIIDSVVGDFLWKNFPHLLTGGSPTEDVLHLYRRLLLARAQPLEQIRAALAEKDFVLSTARVLNFLIWSGWYGHVDEYGFGKPLTTEWETRSVPEARAKAREAWEQQSGTRPLASS